MDQLAPRTLWLRRALPFRRSEIRASRTQKPSTESTSDRQCSRRYKHISNMHNGRWRTPQGPWLAPWCLPGMAGRFFPASSKLLGEGAVAIFGPIGLASAFADGVEGGVDRLHRRIMITMSAAMSPYSMAVPPPSSWKKDTRGPDCRRRSRASPRRFSTPRLIRWPGYPDCRIAVA